MTLHAPTEAELTNLFEEKYGSVPDLGWGPTLRRKFGYFNPEEHYEAVVAQLVTESTRWLDVGCGRNTFPSNPGLAKKLSDRCARMVGVDPDKETLDENPFVHEKVHLGMDEYYPDETFDLITMRMVAEHIARPEALADAVANCLDSGGHVVIYTVNRFSPVPLITRVVPFRFHQPVKKLIWGTEEKDTFPTCFLMNTRRELARLFERVDFDEVLFEYLDDCRSSANSKPLQYAELAVCRGLNAVGITYPENCLLGVYRKGNAPES